jgi:8-oxo-dGTP pyrophosphatase MutT (NUDIX family)
MNAAGTLLLAKTTGRLLLLERADGRGWDQPGGMMSDADEGDPSATACREFDEETGLPPVLLDCIDSFVVRVLPGGEYVTYVPRPPLRAELAYTLFVCTFREEFVPTLSDEHTDWGWFTSEKLPENLHPGTRVAIQVLQIRGDF